MCVCVKMSLLSATNITKLNALNSEDYNYHEINYHKMRTI